MRKQTTTIRCATCKCNFNPQYGRDTISRFCSRKCYLLERWGKTPRNKCKQCGKDISRSGRRKKLFCSFDCRVAAQTGKQLPRRLIRYGKAGAYRARLIPEHPNADSKGYVMEHRLIMESHIGRFLKPTEVVHHKDGNSSNNDLDNLQLMTKNAHDSLHSRERWAARRKAKRSASIAQ